MVFCQKSNFLSTSYVFRENQARKDRFLIFWIKKMLFRPEKRSVKKIKQMEIFQRGESMDFFKKSSFLSCTMFFWGGKSSKKKFFFGVLDKIFQRSKSMVFVKKSNFLSSVFFGQIKTEKIVFLLCWIKKSF